MAKPLGVRVAGTGRISPEESSDNLDKWLKASSEHSNSESEDMLVKRLPIDLVETDPNNPRKLSIEKSLISEISKKYPINTYLKNEDDFEWFEEYTVKVVETFNLTGKTLDDFKSILQFAARLGDPSRLQNPITVWKEDSVFHLISGERRLLAHVMLSATNIACNISETELSPYEIKKLQYAENNDRLDMTLDEDLLCIEEIINQESSLENMTVRLLQKIVGKNFSECGRILKVLKYPSPLLMEAIEDKRITKLYIAANLASLTPEQLKKHLSGKDNKTLTRKTSVITIDKDADINTMNRIIDVLSKNFDIGNILENSDLTKVKGITEAFNNIITHISKEAN